MDSYKDRIEMLNKYLNDHLSASLPSLGGGSTSPLSASARITQRNQTIDRENSSIKETQRIHKPIQPKLPSNKPNYIAGKMKPLGLKP